MSLLPIPPTQNPQNNTSSLASSNKNEQPHLSHQSHQHEHNEHHHTHDAHDETKPKQQSQSIEQYININLQLKTLKITKYNFDDLSLEANISRKRPNRLTSSQTAREYLRGGNMENQKKKDAESQNDDCLRCSSTKTCCDWKPKLSHRRIMNQPKVLLSVEKSKLRAYSSNNRRANSVIDQPSSRLGFRGEKTKSSNSFFHQNNQNSVSSNQQHKNLIIAPHKEMIERKGNKKIPYLNFNYQYILEKRKKGMNFNNKNNMWMTTEERTKKGSNNGYFACFTSENFTRQLTKNSRKRPRTQNAIVRNEILKDVNNFVNPLRL